jgi:hypothetical protein
LGKSIFSISRIFISRTKEPTVHRNLVRFLLLVLFSFTAAAFAQDEFSADLYNAQNGKDLVSQGKIYMAKDKLRMETQQRGSPGGVLIVNLATQTSSLLMPQQKMYMEMPYGQGPQRQAFSFFRTSDVSNACGDWQKLATNRGATCRKVGSETVNGRSTVKYEGIQADGTTSYVWLDPGLRFPVKWQTKSGGGELRNINVSSPPASLFEIPAGYQKMQMPMGMPPNMQHP